MERPVLAIVAASIVLVWAVIIGAAYLARYGFRLGRMSSAGVVAAAYLVLGAAVLSWFGWTWPGLLGVAGMLVPLLAGWVLSAFGPAPR